MNNINAVRERFTTGSVSTASAPKVLEMAYDRIDRDLAQAITAIEARQVEPAHQALTHAQDLVNELLLMLDTSAWQHADSLASIYRYTIELLTFANMKKSVAEVRQARMLLGELGGAFAKAAAQVAGGTAAAATALPSSGLAAPVGGSRLSLQA